MTGPLKHSLDTYEWFLNVKKNFPITLIAEAPVPVEGGGPMLEIMFNSSRNFVAPTANGPEVIAELIGEDELHNLGLGLKFSGPDANATTGPVNFSQRWARFPAALLDTAIDQLPHLPKKPTADIQPHKLAHLAARSPASEGDHSQIKTRGSSPVR